MTVHDGLGGWPEWRAPVGAMRTKRTRRVVLSSSPSPSSSESDPKPVPRGPSTRRRRATAARFVVGAETRASDGERTPASDLSDFVVSSGASEGTSGEGDVRTARGKEGGRREVRARRPSRQRARVLVDSDADEADEARRKRTTRRVSKQELASPVQAVLQHRDEVLRSRASADLEEEEETNATTSATSSDLDDFIASDADASAPSRRGQGPAPAHPWSENGAYWTYVRYLMLCECDEGFHDHLLRLIRGGSDSAEARGARHLLACARQVEASLCDRKRFLVDSAAWSPSFAQCVATRPRMCVEACAAKLGDCEACGRANHPSTYVMRFVGRAYDADALWRFDAPHASKKTRVEGRHRARAREGVEFHVGRFCCARAQVYHGLHHCKHHLLQALRERLERGPTPEAAVDAFLKDERRIKALHQATQRLLAMAERYCSTQGGGSWSSRDGDAVSDEMHAVLYAFHSDYGATTGEEEDRGSLQGSPSSSSSGGEPLYPPGCAPVAVAKRAHLVVLSDTST